MQAMNAVQ